MKTHLNGERIVAVFPCIGGDDEHGWRIVDQSVVTIVDDGRFPALFKVYPRVTAEFGTPYLPGVVENTLPRALRRARQNLGWG